MTDKPLLYVEDEETDVLLLQYALRRAQITNPLKIAATGEEALAYLSGRGQYADREQYPLPGLVLLDLNLPQLSGMKVLEWIRDQPHLGALPVVIYSSSNHSSDLEQAQALGANDYIVKPSALDKITETVQKVKDRWLNHS